MLSIHKLQPDPSERAASISLADHKYSSKLNRLLRLLEAVIKPDHNFIPSPHQKNEIMGQSEMLL